jgi:hypothetical protein
MFPHLYTYQTARPIRPEIRKIHFRTDRFAFEEFCRLLMEEFSVQPKREDATAVLEENLLKVHKTW